MRATGVSIVRISAEYPASFARRIDALATSRPPQRYTWYQAGPGVDLFTSSSPPPDSGAREEIVPANPATAPPPSPPHAQTPRRLPPPARSRDRPPDSPT